MSKASINLDLFLRQNLFPKLVIIQDTTHDLELKTSTQTFDAFVRCMLMGNQPWPQFQNGIRERSIDTHCIRFGLLHSQDEDFKPHDDHEHQDVCEQCLSLFLTIEAVEKHAVVTDDIELKQELLNDIKLGRTYIIEWMCHVLRGVQQEKAKLYAISQLNPSCGFWLSDWALKVIPSMFREGQRYYFGKKGMSVHVDVLLIKAVASSELMKSVYFTTIYRCDQGIIDTICIAEHVLKEIQKDHPNIRQLFRKTNNPGCYSGRKLCCRNRV